MPQTEEERKQKKKLYNKEYRKRNREKQKGYNKVYRKTEKGIKSQTMCLWKQMGLLETKERMVELYEIYTTIKYCEVCDVELTRSGKRSTTDICLDHCHKTGRFRYMLCGNCNRNDKWTKYFC